MFTLFDAVLKIRNGYTFAVADGVLIWQDDESKKPTATEIEEGFAILEQEKQETEQKKQAALSKLQALGLNQDDLEALRFQL